MSLAGDLVETSEGATKLLVPRVHSLKGPGKRQGRVFYNRQMAFSRDVSVMLFEALNTDDWTALDSMAGTGARGIRVANEVRKPFKFDLNDRDLVACDCIRRNIALNGVDNCTALNEDMRCLLSDRYYDYIDIDPFGTPVPYVAAAIMGCKRKGVLGITATDTASLSGTYPKKCVRRYGATPVRCAFGHELGLRILIGYVVREAAKFDRGTRPLLCYYADHYFRLYLRQTEGAGEADRSLAELGYIVYDPLTGEREFTMERRERAFGPLWGGAIWDGQALESLRVGPTLEESARCQKYLGIWREELNLPYHFDVDEIAHLIRSSPPPMSILIERLREAGSASRTHFAPTGFKTDLDLSEILEAVSELARQVG